MQGKLIDSAYTVPFKQIHQQLTKYYEKKLQVKIASTSNALILVKKNGPHRHQAVKLDTGDILHGIDGKWPWNWEILEG